MLFSFGVIYDTMLICNVICGEDNAERIVPTQEQETFEREGFAVAENGGAEVR